ncbi:MAG: hypothetical protein AAGM22_07015 [Acidobacteriota bacterium]
MSGRFLPKRGSGRRLELVRSLATVLGLTFVGLAVAGSAGASPLGTAFTYQGQLTEDGVAVTGLYDFEVRLYDAEQGGAQFGAPATVIDGPVDGGLFSLELDFGQLVFETDESLWLEVATRPAGAGVYTELSPRQTLRPAPYALRSQSQAWSGLTGTPPGFADGVDDDTLAELACAVDELAVWSGSSWTCAAAGTGDITSVLPGPGCGITGGATAGDAELCLSFATVQRRVTGTCPAGGAIREIREDGTVACTVPEPGDYGLAGDSGWFSMPTRSTLDVDFGTSDFDFVFATIRGGNQLSGPFYQPVMGSMFTDYAHGYLGLSGSSATVYNYRYSGSFQTLGDFNDVVPSVVETRLVAVDRTADYDSGWQACAANITYVFNHGLGTEPEMAVVEVAENADGSGWRLPTMMSSNFDGGSWRQTNIVALDSQNVTIRTQGTLASFRAPVSESVTRPSSGFCRVQLFSWTPDYDSGWVPLSTAIGNRDKWFRHNLGTRPRVFMLWVAQNADGSGWRLPALSNVQLNGSRGTQVYNVTDQWAVIKGGGNQIAHFVDGAGSGQSPASGYVRFVAWK